MSMFQTAAHVAPGNNKDVDDKAVNVCMCVQQCRPHMSVSLVDHGVNEGELASLLYHTVALTSQQTA